MIKRADELKPGDVIVADPGVPAYDRSRPFPVRCEVLSTRPTKSPTKTVWIEIESEDGNVAEHRRWVWRQYEVEESFVTGAPGAVLSV